VNVRQSVIISELCRPKVAKCWNFVRNLCVLKKWPLTIKFLKFYSLSFHRLTDRRCVQISWNLADGKSAKSCVIYLKKRNFACLSNCRYCAQMCQGQPLSMYSECSRFHPNLLTFGEVIAERVNTAKSRRKVNSVFVWRLASIRVITASYDVCVLLYTTFKQRLVQIIFLP